MTELSLAGVSEGALLLAAGSFVPACTVVISESAPALAAFVAVASGAARPRRGEVRLDGMALEASPAARRRVASLLADEVLPLAPSVGEAVSRVLSARGEARSASEVLTRFGLDGWQTRAVAGLDRDERRCLGLALALAHERADVLVLYEPLTTSAVGERMVRTAVEEHVARGHVVLLATTSLATAESFGGPHCALHAGSLGVAPRAEPPHAAEAAGAVPGAADTSHPGGGEEA